MMSLLSACVASVHHSAGSQACRKRGFTLLEVLLALALLAVLLGSVLSAVRFYGHLATLGREELQRQRLLLTLDRMFRQDLQSVLLLEQSSPSGQQAGAGETLTEEASPELLAAGGTVRGLWGDDRSLVLVLRKPPQELVLVADTTGEDQAPALGDMRLVGYLVADPGTDELAALVAQQAAQAQQVETPVKGLARWELPLAQGQQALEQQDLSQLAAAAQVLAPEVAGLQLRYFDGQQWFDSWDSGAQGSLPLAVEITLVLLAPQVDSAGTDSAQAEEESVRLVVFLPGAATGQMPPEGETP